MKGLTLGLQEPEKVPMRLEMLRRVEMVCGDRDESISRSDTRFLASLMTERSTPLPLTAPCHTHMYITQIREQGSKCTLFVHIKISLKKCSLITLVSTHNADKEVQPLSTHLHFFEESCFSMANFTILYFTSANLFSCFILPAS